MNRHGNHPRMRVSATNARHAAGAAPAAAVHPRASATPLGYRHAPSRLSGADGNERLTALTGAVLLILLAVEGATIVFLRPLLPVHFFVGMLLVGPVLLKSASTGYRFLRYYAGSPDYRRKGPPAPLLRLIGPFLLLSTVAVLGTGVGLTVAGPGNAELLLLHKASFVIWFVLMTVHVLAYVWRIPRLVAADWRHRPGARAGTPRRGNVAAPRRPVGRAARWAALAVALVSGLILAAATLHMAVPWQEVVR